MAGSTRFESNSASPEEYSYAANYPSIGQRGNYSSPVVERSGSFRNGVESRMFCSGTNNTSLASSISTGDSTSLGQFCSFEPISVGDQKYSRSGEVRRMFGISSGSTADDNLPGTAHFKPPLPVAREKVKRFRASLVDTAVKARYRAKKLEENIQKLNKYEASTSKKLQRNETFTNERGGSNLVKVGTQNHPDLMTQRAEERTKNNVLNKRVRSSVAETRAEGRNNILGRQASVIGKDRDMVRDGGEGSDIFEDKIHRLSAGGEGWDKRMKRKRSAGSIFNRATDSDGEIKPVMYRKLSNEPGLQFSDTQGFRSGSSNVMNGTHKSDNTTLPVSVPFRVALKNELEKGSPRDFTAGLNKERLTVQGKNKLSIREDSHPVLSTPVTKGKASRAPRSGHLMPASPNFPRTTGTLEGWEQPSNKVTSVVGVNNRKRPMPASSSSPPMAPWDGQIPLKNSRTKRTNVVASISTHDDVQVLSERHSLSDLGTRINSTGSNGRSVSNGAQQFRMKYDPSSPARLSESEESGASEIRESRLKEKGIGSGEVEERYRVQNPGFPGLPLKKDKTVAKEDVEAGVQRQGRSIRGSSISRASPSPLRDKVESHGPTKPQRASRNGLEKMESKSRRPLKKLSDRKSFTRLGQNSNGSSPDFAGESDDDREELLKAANFASKSSYLACSSSFWKKMELKFSSVSLEGVSYLKQQLKCMEELQESLTSIHGHDNDNVGDHVDDEGDLLPHIPGRRHRSLLDQNNAEEWVSRVQNSERRNKSIPLYQRVLSALIVEDEIAEFDENGGGRSTSFRCIGDDYSNGACLPTDVSPENMDDTICEYGSLMGFQTQKQCAVDRFSCNRNKGLGFQNKLCNNYLQQKDRNCMPSEIGSFPNLYENGHNEPESLHSNASGNSSFDYRYEHMSLDDKLLLELQTVGIYPERVPDLADREDEVIDEDIVELQKGLCQQVGKKKQQLNKLIKAVEDSRELEERSLEQVAMERLVELAYKKLLATRGSSSSRSGVPKVSKQAASAFVKRTLARCKKFEDVGKSCFSEPLLQDIILAVPPCHNNVEFMSLPRSTIGSNMQHGACNSQPGFSNRNDSLTPTHVVSLEFAKSGPMLNRGKKKEVLLDDVGSSPIFRAPSPLRTLSGGEKGKRSERERVTDALTRNSVAKTGRPSVSNSKGERKMKTLPKQKTSQLSTSGNEFINKFKETSHSVYPTSGDATDKKEFCLISEGSTQHDPSEEVKERTDISNLRLSELDAIEELGAANDLGGHQDLSTWFNFDDDDGLQDHDSIVGLDIPMDDLSDLNMML